MIALYAMVALALGIMVVALGVFLHVLSEGETQADRDHRKREKEACDALRREIDEILSIK